MTLFDRLTFLSLVATPPMVFAIWFVARKTRFYGRPDSSDRFDYDVHNALFLLLAFVALSRAFVGVAKYDFGADLWYVSYLFPIRVGGMNWGLIKGLPFLVPCLLVLWRMDLVLRWLGERKNSGLYLFLFALLFGWSFGGIQGGSAGLTDFFHSMDHIHDATLFDFTRADLLSHDYRRYPDHEPHYLASHFKSHPPFVLAIWSFFLKYVSMEAFSLLCTVFFAAMIYFVYFGFERELGRTKALAITMLFLFTPALLIYGIGGDDVLSYALWALTLCLAYIGIRQENAALFAAANVALVAAMGMQYSSIVLLPAMFALPSEAMIGESPSYVWRFRYWIVASLVFVILFWGAVYYVSGFDYPGDVRDFFVWYRDQSLGAMIASGQYTFALGSRLMDIGDFLLLGGPVIAFPIYMALRQLRWRPMDWKLRNLALGVLFAYVILQTPGAGETARGWGGLYAVLLFGMVAKFYAAYPGAIQTQIMRHGLGWALALQIPINFSW